mgnify:CR=1 FL=1
MDGALGFNTFEKQDKVLVGLNGGMDAAVTVRILQEQGFAVQAALVHFAGMADDAVETAQNAAKAFIAELPRHVRVGIVAFAGSAQLAQLPTQSHEDLVKAIDSFQLQRGTATGNGIMLALATLFPNAGIDIAALGERQAMRPRSLDEVTRQDPAKTFTPVTPGSYNSAAIIMLTDGQRTTGVDPLEAAK